MHHTFVSTRSKQKGFSQVEGCNQKKDGNCAETQAFSFSNLSDASSTAGCGFVEGGKQRFEKNVDIVFGLLPPLSGDGDNPSFVNISFFTCYSL